MVPKPRKNTIKYKITKIQLKAKDSIGYRRQLAVLWGTEGDTCAGEWRHLEDLVSPIWKTLQCVPALCLVYVLLFLFSLAYAVLILCSKFSVCHLYALISSICRVWKDPSLSVSNGKVPCFW